MAQRILKEGEPEREARLDRGDGEFFYTRGHQWLALGMVGYLYEEPPEKVVDLLRNGLREVRTMLELLRRTHAWEIWDFFLYAVAVNDRPFARFLATMPVRLWFNETIKPVPWLIQQVRAAFALFLAKEKRAGELLEQLRIMVFEEELPIELSDQVSLIRNVCELLEDLHQRREADFRKHLQTRMELRTTWFTIGGGAAPISLIDLHGLGLCRLARDRGMKTDVRHVYLPLEMLDVP